jgi:predicted  nucleic acid-binding Zn-ribbon protein
VNVKALYLLLVILFCSTPLYAEKVSVLTEIEMIQEKLWYLNRDIGASKASLEEQQKQLKLIASGITKERLELNQRLAALNQAATDLREGRKQRENDLEKFGEALNGLATEAIQQNQALLDQAGKIGALEESLSALRDELTAQQTDTGQALTDLRSQVAEAREQMVETRSQLDTLGQDMGGRVEQIGYWAAGAALFLALILTIVMALRKRDKPQPGDRKGGFNDGGPPHRKP